MALKIADAVKSQSKLRAAFTGPPGSGKTYSSLVLAKHLRDILGLKTIVVADSEGFSSSKYADITPFKVIDLSSGGNYSPDVYIEAIDLAEDNGADIICIDSGSHAYMGEGGLLAQADAAQKRGGNSFSSWRGVSSKYSKLIQRILHSRAHVIITYRTRTEYSLEKDSNGKNVVKKIGLEAITKDGNSSSYEMDLVFALAQDNSVTMDKTRCSELNGKSFDRIDRNVAQIVAAWLTDGAPMVEESAPPDPAAAQTDSTTEQPTGWLQKIESAESVADLDALLPILKTLKPESQKDLLGPYRAKKAQLSGQ